MMYNHYGKTVDSEKPIVGVIHNRSVACLADVVGAGVDLDYADRLDAMIADHVHSPKPTEDDESGCECEDGVVCECGVCWGCDSLGEDSGLGGEGTWLIGSWAIGDDGKYEPDTTGDYAAICDVDSHVTQVMWSKWVSRAALCPPCCPGRGNLNAAGPFLTYTVPPNLFGEADEHLPHMMFDAIKPLDSFTRSYVEFALWHSADDDDKSLRDNYRLDDLTPEAIARMAEDCRVFQDSARADLDVAYRCDGGRYNERTAGQDFWLTRNRDGTGFWDSELGEVGQRLTNMACSFGVQGLYVGGDGSLRLW